MNFNLKRMRKLADVTQKELAAALDVNLSTIGNWERGVTYPDAEQIWNCAEILGCTPNDILGWYETHPNNAEINDPYEKELVCCYRDSTTQRKASILQTARDAAGMSRDSAEYTAHESEGLKAI